MNDLIKGKLSLLPPSPGCYLMKNKEGTVIYVGKAKKLKNRVHSYFVGAHDYKTTKLVSEIVDFEYIVTGSEKEALLLEINLIKDYSPQYNIMFMDNTYYPYIQMTNEEHPRLKIVRDAKEKKAKHFGPFPDATAARETYKLLDRLYPLRKCNHIPKKPCLYYSLNQCLAPCVRDVDQEEYVQIKKEIVKLLNGDTKDKIHELTKIDHWFLQRLENIHLLKEELSKFDKETDVSESLLRKAKQYGFSDFQIGRLTVKNTSLSHHEKMLKVRDYRKKLGVLPCVKQIDTLAGEYPAMTNYLYVTYNGFENDVKYEHDGRSVIVLGSGAYRIGSSVEFDWCGVSALNTIRKAGYRSVMINYNPETVSTDYDMCDRLYFDELSFERVLDVIDLEQPRGVIVSVGGQIPNNLAMKLHRQSVPVLGTSPISIDRAENRNKFSAMLDQLGIDQPAWQELTSLEDVKGFVEKVGYPVLVRPSYVLSGAAMNVCYDEEELENFLKMAAEVSKEYPVVVSQFLQNTKEIEFDAVAQNGEVVEYAISEHVEFAGVHSGDATLVFPAQKIYFATARRIKKISRQIAKELNISGPFNIQFLARNNEVKVIECNLRASRSFPFVSKVLKRNFIETATRIMLDAPYTQPDKSAFDIDRIGVKASQFSFSRLHKADPVLGVDMSSTGEVGCIGDDFSEALLNAMIATGFRIPRPEKGVMFSSGAMKSKVDLLDASRMLFAKGYKIYATAGTAAFLNAHGVTTEAVYWPDERPDAENNVMTMIADHAFDLIVNIPKNHTKRELTNGYKIRRGAIDHNIPLITNARLASAFIEAFCEMKLEDIQIKSWQEYK